MATDDKRTRKALLSEIDELQSQLKDLRSQASYPQRDLLTAQDLIWQLDRNGCITYLNSAWEKHGRFNVPEMLGHKFTEFQPPDTALFDLALFKNRLQGGQTIDHETIFISRTGEHLHMLINAVATRNEKGEIVGTHGTAVDITDKVNLLNRLKDSEHKHKEKWEELEQVYQSAPVGLCLIDTSFRFIRINQVLAAINGRRIDEHIGRTIRDIIPELADDLEKVLAEVMATGQSQMKIDLSGKTSASPDFSRDFLGSYHPLLDNEGRVHGVNLVVEDVTDRKIAEAALRDSEERYRSLVDNSDDLIWRMNTDGTVVYVSPSITTLSGYESDEVTGLNLIGGEVLGELVSELLKKRLKGDFGFDAIVYELNFPRKDGTSFIAEVRSSPIIGPNNEIKEIQGTARDITERKKVEHELATIRRLNELILHSAGEGIYGVDMSGITTFVNPTAERLLGWKASDLIGKTQHAMIHHTRPDGLPFPTSECPVSLSLLDGDLRHIDNEYFWRADGSYFEVEYTSAPIYNESNDIEGAVVSFRDITQRRLMEAELLKIQKLESVGLLAGGIAHDLNNYLTTIIGNMGLARISESRSDRDAYLDETERAFVQVKNLTQQLLTFAKGHSPVLIPGSMIELLKDTIQFTLRGSKIRSDLQINDDLWPVLIDEGQINQVISNLIINAQQAMQNSGRIVLSAANLVIDSEAIYPLPQGRYIRMSIEDSGPGIPEHLLPKVFDPFFSTKPNGSGLGLATSFSIIRKHNGHIAVSSTEGQGARFDILLPATLEERSEVQPDSIKDWISGTGNILVMDDSADILRLCEGLLGKMGYSITTAAHGEQAIELYGSALDARPFDAVILDLTIVGGMGGIETMQKLQQMDPNVKAIVSSGYSNDPVMANYQTYGFSSMLSKPYKISEMSRVVSAVLTS